MKDRRQKLSVREMIDRLSIDDKTSEPYYKQLIRHIEGLIEAGEIGHGLGLPSERDLADALNLSRTTIKRCYDELRHAGLLNANGRGGTSVNNPPTVSAPMGKLKDFTEEMQELGMTPSTRLESHEIVSDRTIASIFERPSNASFLRLVRVRLADGVPMSREVAWFDLGVAPKLADWDTSGSIYTYLQDVCKIKLSWAEQTIEAMMSSEIETKTFGFTASSPCLFMKRRTFSGESKLIEYVEGAFRGDAYVYRVKLDV
ncbi:MAG: GntR family transcriptional regulator [Methylotenera sp.]|nr:GntR family transcriptional regulator [Methylotenera sp.]NOT64516.1 GntR family transcriptional regulator [Methylotenera sp.]